MARQDVLIFFFDSRLGESNDSAVRASLRPISDTSRKTNMKFYIVTATSQQQPESHLMLRQMVNLLTGGS